MKDPEINKAIDEILEALFGLTNVKKETFKIIGIHLIKDKLKPHEISIGELDERSVFLEAQKRCKHAKDVAVMLGISERQVFRLKNKYNN